MTLENKIELMPDEIIEKYTEMEKKYAEMFNTTPAIIRFYDKFNPLELFNEMIKAGMSKYDALCFARIYEKTVFKHVHNNFRMYQCVKK